MGNSQITIFYSWQSDLPGSESRNIIQESIKEAVRILRDTVDIEADRDTSGEFGSPDIAQTIFSKIDNCDIFIADVTAVCKYEITDSEGNKKTKYMPNPNVMIELGYATSVVGWENVICMLNSDYGSPENMPFDIANRRLTPFSLRDAESKGQVKRELRSIIQATVENILLNGKRPKKGFSNLRVGTLLDNTFVTAINPYVIAESVKYTKAKAEIVALCREAYELINGIHLPDVPAEGKEPEVDSTDTEQSNTIAPIVRPDGTVLTPVPTIQLDLYRTRKTAIKQEDKEQIVLLVEQYLDEKIDINGDFFNIGNLKERTVMGLHPYTDYDGTDEEVAKHEAILNLNVLLHRLKLWDWYLTSFENYLVIPLAIENTSTLTDENIDVSISINKEDVSVIYPSANLINPEMEGLQGILVEEDIIKELLMMSETSTISYDSDISFSGQDMQARINVRLNGAGINGNPEYDEEDYRREISKFIASPIEDNDSEFIFTIENLRAQEKKWLGPSLLLQPIKDSFEIHYTIKSQNSDGSLSGVLRYEKE